MRACTCVCVCVWCVCAGTLPSAAVLACHPLHVLQESGLSASSAELTLLADPVCTVLLLTVGCCIQGPAADRDPTSSSRLGYDPIALQLWILQACQGLKGGLRDKPGKPPDFYHTCYCLSGLSSAQHAGGWVLGPPENQLRQADGLCNVLSERLAHARAYFAEQTLGE